MSQGRVWTEAEVTEVNPRVFRVLDRDEFHFIGLSMGGGRPNPVFCTCQPGRRAKVCKHSRAVAEAYFPEEIRQVTQVGDETPRRPAGGYVSVERRSKNPELLLALDQIRLSNDAAVQLVEAAREQFSLPPVEVKFTQRSKTGIGGSYPWDGPRRLCVKHEPSVDTLIHELTHHWVHTKMTGGNPRQPHNIDFINRLDKLAEWTERYLREKETS